jgi:hypothetical protein
MVRYAKSMNSEVVGTPAAPGQATRPILHSPSAIFLSSILGLPSTGAALLAENIWKRERRILPVLVAPFSAVANGVAFSVFGLSKFIVIFLVELVMFLVWLQREAKSQQEGRNDRFGGVTSAWKSVGYALVLATLGFISGILFYDVREERFQFGGGSVAVRGFGVDKEQADAVMLVLSEVGASGDLQLDRFGGGFRLHLLDAVVPSSDELGRLLAAYTKETIYLLKYDEDGPLSATRYDPVRRPPPPLPKPPRRSKLWPW